MRINQYVAQATGMSRRAADAVIKTGRVSVNDVIIKPSYDVEANAQVSLDGKVITPQEKITIMLHKPVGYVCSRAGQGSKTVYKLLPPELHALKPVGRLDKDSSGLLLMTNDGQLTQELTHPSYRKKKVYEVRLDKPLRSTDKRKIEQGIALEDGVSKLKLAGQASEWTITMHEGRNRQIRRTFEVMGYVVTTLHRTRFGAYNLGTLSQGKWRAI